MSMTIKRRIETISYLLNLEARPNGSNYNWSPTTREGHKISLYYDVSRPEYQLDSVEAYDPSGHLGLPTSDDVAGIGIMDLPKYFPRYH